MRFWGDDDLAIVASPSRRILIGPPPEPDPVRWWKRLTVILLVGGATATGLSYQLGRLDERVERAQLVMDAATYRADALECVAPR